MLRMHEKSLAFVAIIKDQNPFESTYYKKEMLRMQFILLYFPFPLILFPLFKGCLLIMA